LSEGVVLVTAEASRQVVTFSLRASPMSLANFPAPGMPPNGVKGGAMLAGTAAILRYLQNRTEIPSPNGPADSAVLGQYLASYCTTSRAGQPVCDGLYSAPSGGDTFVNPWRVSSFTGGRVDAVAEKADPAAVRDALAQGSPVLLALSMPRGGSHFVVATGVRADGSLAVVDPIAAFARGTLQDYLASGATLSGALRFAVRSPSPSTLVVFAEAPLVLNSPAGECGATVAWPAANADPAAAPGSGKPAEIHAAACDGRQPFYQLDITAESGFRGVFTDGSEGGGQAEISGAGASSFQITKAAGWIISTQQASFESTSVVNAASFQPELAPGSLVSVFGVGLGVTSRLADTKVDINGTAARVLGVFPFQINLALPGDLPPGEARLRVQSPFGRAEHTIVVREVAPALFPLGDGQAAVLNSDYTLNTPLQPARRGQAAILYGTGFGAVDTRGQLQVTRLPVTAEWNGIDLPVLFAGLTPGYVGLYQVNLQIPANTPPDLSGRLVLRQSGVSAGAVRLAIQ
jgi:uncharacterized protein (TIGR03437 family)